MRLMFLGATATVTGSKFLVTASKRRVLVDCSLFQGFKQLRLRNWAPLPVHAASIHAVALHQPPRAAVRGPGHPRVRGGPGADDAVPRLPVEGVQSDSRHSRVPQ